MAREFTASAEENDITLKWASVTAFAISSTNAHKDSQNNGGTRCYRSTLSTGNLVGLPWAQGLVEGIIKDARFTDTAPGATLSVQWRGPTSTVLGSVRWEADGFIRAYTSTGTLVATSALAYSKGRHRCIETRVRLLDAGGLIQVHVDENYVTPALTFSGDTKPGADTVWQSIALDNSVNAESTVDDIAVNSLTMSYDGGVGIAPTAGMTITGGTSGSTAVITAVVAGSTGVSGRIYLRTQSAAFVDNEGLTSAGPVGFIALVNAPTARYVDGLEPQSTRPGNTFMIAESITANGFYPPDGTAGRWAATPLGDYRDIDEWPAAAYSTTDYAEGDTAAERSSFLHAALPSSVGTVVGFTIMAIAQKTGVTINNIQLSYRDAGVDIDSTSIPLSSSYGYIEFPWWENANGNVAWTVASANAAEIGGEFLA